MLDFRTESWLWYGMVMLVTSLRFISRFLHVKSCLRFKVEDYLIILITCAYTIFIVLINICMVTNTNLIDPNDPATLTPEDIAERTYGSKLILCVEQLFCFIQWGTKACLLLLYYRLTENLVQNKFVKVVGAYSAITYLIMEGLYFGYWCRPFSDYWQTPTDNYQCTTAYNHLIVNLSFNLSCDLLIMSIPLPLLLRARLEIKRKILLCFPFTLGFFSIVCAIISKYVSFTNPFSPVWSFWYTREASCILIVANMPYMWGLVRRLFKLKSFWGNGSDESDNQNMDLNRTHSTAMELVGGELREIQGLDITTTISTPNTDDDESSTTWNSPDLKEKLTPEINIEVRDVSENSSPTMTCSSAATREEQWKSVDWARSTAKTDITQTTTRQSNFSPDALTPPSPALTQSSGRRASTAEFRRASVLDARRASAYSVRHGRLSVSEACRRSTPGSVQVDAIDRLYRLDDEDLITDIEAARPRSRNSFRE